MNFQVCGLTCEYTEQPLGLQTRTPRFSWRVKHPDGDCRQEAYQVLVSSTPEGISAGRGDLWDSGRNASAMMGHIEYGGRPLVSRERCWWTVRVWDQAGTRAEASPSWFEMGLLRPEDWHDALWVGAVGNWTGRAILFRHLFDLGKPAVRGRVYLSGLGWHELRINGTRVGDRVLEPPPTDYALRVLYSTYDITAILHEGKNSLDVAAGHGWYGMPKILLRLVVEHQDGTSYDQVSGRVFSFCSIRPGAWLNDSVYEGEIFDSRRAVPEWDGTPLAPVPPEPPRHELPMGGRRASSPGGKLVANSTDPIRVVRRFAPRSVSNPKPGVYVIDVGQNMAGWMRMRVTAPAGTTVTLTHSEVIYPDGTVNQENLLYVRGSDVYICRGGGEETYEPRFTYHGFRFVQVEGYPGTPLLDAFEACQVRSDIARRSTFHCDNELLNRINTMVIATEESNQHGVPTDCPQRGERQGWLNDMTVRAEELVYNFHAGRFLTKWLDDIADTQDPHGAISDTAPYNWGNQVADPVSVAPGLLSWLMYRHYGDRRILSEHYLTVQRWHAFLQSNTRNNLVQFSNWGDWAPPIEFAVNKGAASRDTPGVLMSSGCWLFLTRLLGKTARVLGKVADAEGYFSQERLISRAINDRFWDEATGGYGSNNQACNSFALWLGIVPAERIPRVMDNLVRDVMEKNHGHLTTGNLCTKFLLEALSDHGRADVAFHVATREEYPSWGYMLANGATTLWERWEYMTDSGMCSHNHPMLGSVSSWLTKYLAGILDDETAEPGQRYILRPCFVSGLRHVEGSLQTLHGLLGISWTRKGTGFELRVEVPFNSTGQLELQLSPSSCSVKGSMGVAWDGKSGTPGAGVRSVSALDGMLRLVLGSGEHAFTVDVRG